MGLAGRIGVAAPSPTPSARRDGSVVLDHLAASHRAHAVVLGEARGRGHLLLVERAQSEAQRTPARLDGPGPHPYSFLTCSTQILSRQTYLAGVGLVMLFGLAVDCLCQAGPIPLLLGRGAADRGSRPQRRLSVDLEAPAVPGACRSERLERVLKRPSAERVAVVNRIGVPVGGLILMSWAASNLATLRPEARPVPGRITRRNPSAPTIRRRPERASRHVLPGHRAGRLLTPVSPGGAAAFARLRHIRKCEGCA